MAKDKCRQDASIIRRATAALVPLGKEKVWQIRKSQLEGKKGRAYLRFKLPGSVCV
jgi:hypothetical protein